MGRLGGADAQARAASRLGPFDLVHAHYAAPAGDAVRRARPGVPVVVSVHGGDVLAVAERSAAGARAVRSGLENARLVLANSAGMAARARELGAQHTQVVHLGTDLPAASARARQRARHRRAPRRPQAPRRRAARAVAAARQPPRAALGRRRRRAGTRLARAARRRARARRARPLPRPASAARGARGRAGRRRVRAAERRRGVRRRLRRGDGRRGAGDRLPRRARAGGDRRRRRRAAARAARRPGGARRRAARAARRARRGGASSATPRARPSRPASRGSSAAARPSRRTRTRCDEAGRGRRTRGEAAADEPVLFVTNHAPAFRIGAFAALHEAEDVVFALVGGGVRHGGAIVTQDPPFPVIRPSQRAVGRLAASGRFRAVVAGLSGRVALPAAYLGARSARHPVRPLGDDLAPPAHAGARALLPAAAPPLPPRGRDRHVRPARVGLRPLQGRHATGVRGAAERRRRVLDGARAAAPPRAVPGPVCGPARAGEGAVGAPAWRAWPHGRRSSWPATARSSTDAAHPHRPRWRPNEVRNLYAGSDVVVVPSIPTRDFLEPWGLVVNEAFDQGVPVIATTAVGAAAGGLVRHEETGLVVPPATTPRSRRAIRRLHDDPELRARLGAAGRASGRERLLPRRLGGRDEPGAGGRRRQEGAASVAAAMPRILLVMVLTLLVAAPAAIAGTRARHHPRLLRRREARRQLHAVRDPRRAQQPPGRHRPVLRLPRRARARARRQRRQASRRRRRRRARRGRRLRWPVRAAHPERPRGAGRARPGGRRAAKPRSRSATAPSCPAPPASPPTRPATTIPTTLLAVLILLGVAALVGRRPVRPQACPPSPARLTRPPRSRRGPHRSPHASLPRAGAAGAALAERDRLLLAGDRVRRRRRAAAGAHDVRRDRRSCCSAPASAPRRCSCPRARAGRLHGGLTLAAVALLAAYTAVSIVWSLAPSDSWIEAEPHVLLPLRVRRHDGARAARARAAGRRCCTGSRSPASSSAAGRC